jgi:hypothetical protein
MFMYDEAAAQIRETNQKFVNAASAELPAR